MRRRVRWGLAAAVVAVVAGCGSAPRTDPAPPVVILVSLDGFRPDYVDRFETPALDRLIEDGVRAEHLVPVFPTKTFPNHYTIVTGLYPDHHGMVLNDMWDPEWQREFDNGALGTAGFDPWWGGEPVWVTARRQGRVTMSVFWPGSDAEIQGLRPHDWLPYDGTLPDADRVDRVLTAFDRSPQARPAFVTLYFSRPDDVGHEFGPDSPEVGQAVRDVDAALGRLLDGLASRRLLDAVNLLVVSDHGMAASPPERVVVAGDVLPGDDSIVRDWSPVLTVWPKEGRLEDVWARLRPGFPHVTLYRKADLPERWHLGTHRRVAPIVGVVEEGWTLAPSEAWVERRRSRWMRGQHGYDNLAPSMAALLVARGPAFRRGAVVPPVENIHLYELMCHILGLVPAPNDGRLATVADLLVKAPEAAR